MKTLVVNYSLTENNKLLAEYICARLKADCDEIAVLGKMTGAAIFRDTFFNGKPALAPTKYNPAGYEMVVLIAPVWIGKIASPLRSYIKKYHSVLRDFAFMTISGGALGKNTKVQEELHKLAGKQPVETKQLYINDILPADEQNDQNKTSAYRLTQSDLDIKFTAEIDDFLRNLNEVAETGKMELLI